MHYAACRQMRAANVSVDLPLADARVDYQTAPARYRHWRLTFDGPIATLAMNIAEDGGIRPGYKLKLNSYDLGVDIELHDALNRIRFEHPETHALVITSLRERILARAPTSSCSALVARLEGELLQFTNETRNGIEDSSRHSGSQVRRGRERHLRRRRLRAGDRLRRIFVDRRSLQRRFSLPEVPLLGVLPARGGHAADRQAQGAARSRGCLLHDDRGRARRAREARWRLVDESPRRRRSRSGFGAGARACGDRIARRCRRALALTPLARSFATID